MSIARDSSTLVADSTIVANFAENAYQTAAGIAVRSGSLVVRNSTVTGNLSDHYYAAAGGISAEEGAQFELANSIVTGNFITGRRTTDLVAADTYGAITNSNGHNIIGTDALGDVPGDRENIGPSQVFAALDPRTSGGALGDNGIVLLRNDIGNPALSGADPLSASPTGQLGTTNRPTPTGSLPDIGSVELNQALSTTASANNDVLTGTSSANTIRALGGADYLKGLGGNDTLYGGDGRPARRRPRQRQALRRRRRRPRRLHR